MEHCENSSMCKSVEDSRRLWRQGSDKLHEQDLDRWHIPGEGNTTTEAGQPSDPSGFRFKTQVGFRPRLALSAVILGPLYTTVEKATG
jgi:hypothetical protein